MNANPSETIIEKLQELRTELVDLAFRLDCQGQATAADVAITTSARVNELCRELLMEHARLAL